MKNDGLELFIRFALGAVERGLCADKWFAMEMISYLKDGKGVGLEKKIKDRFKTAWPQLSKIAEKINKSPLDLETVIIYIIGSEDSELDRLSHNSMPLVRNSYCAVFPGIVAKVSKKFNVIEIKTGMNPETIKFVSFPIELKKGDKIVYHWSGVIKKITASEYRRLSK